MDRLNENEANRELTFIEKMDKAGFFDCEPYDAVKEYMGDLEKTIDLAFEKIKYQQDAIESLQSEILDLKRKQDSGLLVELPDDAMKIVYSLYWGENHHFIAEDYLCNCDLNDVGKTVFLTIEDAEKALKECKSEVVEDGN